MKSKEQVMEIIEAYDLMGTYAGAASLLGCSHHTVERHVQARDAGRPLAVRKTKPRLTEPFEPKIAEWVEKSSGKIRADKAHAKLVTMGHEGSPRTTAYAVKREKMKYLALTVRVHKPWVTEPGGWVQYDFGDGPIVDGRMTVLFVAWLAWSKFRVVIPLRDRTMPQVLAALDMMFRLIGGVTTYVLSDNEKTLTTGHVANLPIRNREVVDFGLYYSTVFHSCVPFDPATKGGVERSVALAKADIVPMDINLVDEYESFAKLQEACAAFMDDVNGKQHSVTRRRPVDMLEVERKSMHVVPEHPYTATLGVARKVPANTPMVTFEYGQYSVPYTLLGQTVWVRRQTVTGAERVIVTSVTPEGPVEVARHSLAVAGQPAIDDTHFPKEAETVLRRSVRPVTKTETAFLELGAGAEAWLRAAAVQGVARIVHKMGHALTLAQATTPEQVDRVLDLASQFHRFNTEDMDSILASLRVNSGTSVTETVIESGQSLAQGTTSWVGFGASDTNADPDTEGLKEVRDGNTPLALEVAA